MKRDPGRAGAGEVGNDAIHGLDHQVHVDGRLDAVATQRPADRRPDGEIRHVVIVHYVEVNDVRARIQHRLHVLAQAREVGGQDRRRNERFMHGE